MPTVYVPIGIPGSGKSTYYETLGSHVTHVSPDNHLYRNGTYATSPQRRKEAWRQAFTVVEGAIARGEDVYFDATNLTVKARQRLLWMARHARHAYRVVGLHFVVPFDVCEERNRQRPANRRPTLEAMQDMERSLEVPDLREGFTDIRRVGGQ